MKEVGAVRWWTYSSSPPDPLHRLWRNGGGGDMYKENTSPYIYHPVHRCIFLERVRARVSGRDSRQSDDGERTGDGVGLQGSGADSQDEREILII